MKSFFVWASGLSLILFSCSNGKKVDKLETDKDKVSYAIGLSFENSLSNLESTMPLDESPSVDEFIKGMQSVIGDTKGKSSSYVQGVISGSQIQNYLNNIDASDQVDMNVVYAAIRAKYNKDSILLKEDEVGEIIKNYFGTYDEKFQAKQEENRKARLDKEKADNQKSSEEFMNANKSKPGVQTTSTGLQYKVLKEGTGEKAKADQKVTINYTGKLTDGTEFDSTKGTPVSRGVSDFIPGFTEGLQLMNKGGKYILYIPAAQAYGENAPGTIGPNQALIFEVEMVDIQPFSAEELKQREEQKKRQQEMQQRQMQQMMQQQMQQQGAGAN